MQKGRKADDAYAMEVSQWRFSLLRGTQSFARDSYVLHLFEEAFYIQSLFVHFTNA